jgi:predicted extracellular nuclease
MNVAALQDIGNVVRVTAVVDTYFTTIELVNATSITLVSGGNPALQPRQLSTGAAASSQWEGTYIEVTAPITAKVTQTGAINYTVNDGSGNLVVRVVSTVGAPEFNSGQTITARGAGGQFRRLPAARRARATSSRAAATRRRA